MGKGVDGVTVVKKRMIHTVATGGPHKNLRLLREGKQSQWCVQSQGAYTLVEKQLSQGAEVAGVALQNQAREVILIQFYACVTCGSVDLIQQQKKKKKSVPVISFTTFAFAIIFTSILLFIVLTFYIFQIQT